MRHLIYEVSTNKDLFYCIVDGRKVGFYLTRNLASIFSQHLKRGYLVDFEINKQTKVINKTKYYQVNHFNKILSLNPHVLLYDINDLRRDMKEVISKYKYYLFLDFEMTMPGYKKGPFQAEIIQFGGLLTDNKGNKILDRNYFIQPNKKISVRTIKFLKLDMDLFRASAKSYEYFYLDLKDIINTYQPKIVVWGKNDILALKDSYRIHKLLPLTSDYNFFDLLTLHKDFFNLNQDLGLFKAYQTYFPHLDIEPQIHDAKDDAKVTKAIFFEFINEKVK